MTQAYILFFEGNPVFAADTLDEIKAFFSTYRVSAGHWGIKTFDRSVNLIVNVSYEDGVKYVFYEERTYAKPPSR